MRISDIGTYKGDTMYVEFGGNEKIFLHKKTVCKLNLEKGMDIPETAVRQALSENTYRKACERALYLLDSREYGYVELFKKLEKSYEDDICYRVCNHLAEKGIIDDRRYAAHLAAKYCERKKYGSYRAKQELIRHGLSAELSDGAVSEFSEGEAERLREVVERKYERYLTDRKGEQKVKNALLRLGYSYSDIKEALDVYDIP